MALQPTGGEARYKLLLNMYDIEVNSQSQSGQTALSQAVWEGHVEVVKLLLNMDGIEVNIGHQDGETTLSLAAMKRHVEVVKLLLETDNIEINIENQMSETALSWAACKGHVEVVDLLTQHFTSCLSPSRSSKPKPPKETLHLKMSQIQKE